MDVIERPHIERRASRRVDIGGVAVGGGAPIVVQSMTNTDTADVAATVAQVRALALAGSELVRVTINTSEAAEIGRASCRERGGATAEYVCLVKGGVCITGMRV